MRVDAITLFGTYSRLVSTISKNHLGKRVSFAVKITRNDENRYEAELPFKHNSLILSDNYELSKKR